MARSTNEERKVIKEVREKPVYYIKTENTVVILDKKDYDNRMKKKLGNGRYSKLTPISYQNL